MDTMTNQICLREVFDQWAATGTVPWSYLKSVLGDRTDSVSPSDPTDRGRGTIVASGVIRGEMDQPAQPADSSLNDQSPADRM